MAEQRKSSSLLALQERRGKEEKCPSRWWLKLLCLGASFSVQLFSCLLFTSSSLSFSSSSSSFCLRRKKKKGPPGISTASKLQHSHIRRTNGRITREKEEEKEKCGIVPRAETELKQTSTRQQQQQLVRGQPLGPFRGLSLFTALHYANQ